MGGPDCGKLALLCFRKDDIQPAHIDEVQGLQFQPAVADGKIIMLIVFKTLNCQIACPQADADLCRIGQRWACVDDAAAQIIVAIL